MLSNSKVSTADIITDFSNYKLHRSGYEAYSKQQGIEAPTAIQRVVREVGEQFETAYFNSFDDMTNQINIHGKDLEDIVYSILDNTFDTGITWGRVVGALVFSAKLSVKAETAGRTDVVIKIIRWTTMYLEEPKFDNWINQHGGWNGFLQFYKNPQDRNGTINGAQFTWNKAYRVGLDVINRAAGVFNTILG